MQRTLGRLSKERFSQERMADPERRGVARRPSHAEAGLKFFQSLRESHLHLEACEWEVASLRVSVPRGLATTWHCHGIPTRAACLALR